MIEVVHLTKRYGDHVAVDDLSFSVRPGIVTGFLGPNGAGKSTTMRMILGLDRPSSGHATINGKAFAQHRSPLHEIGALIEARGVHPGRPGRDHLRALAATIGISDQRVDEVLEMVGLGEVGRRRSGGFSLGMGQRLGIASALLGDPSTIMLDEPVNGLDPEGILWMRNLLKSLASEGRAVLVSSHLMSEMALTAEHFVIIGQGKLIADVSSAELIAMTRPVSVVVRSPRAEELRSALRAGAAEITTRGPEAFEVVGMSAEAIGQRAWASGIELHELTPIHPSLEDTFMELTRDSFEYHGVTTTSPAPTSNHLEMEPVR